MLSNKSANGTSYHGDTITATFNELIAVIGFPQYVDNTGVDKVNYDWTCQLPNGDVFTIYDWKMYRLIEDDEIVEWHIGSHSKNISMMAKDYVEEIINNYVVNNLIE